MTVSFARLQDETLEQWAKRLEMKYRDESAKWDQPTKDLCLQTMTEADEAQREQRTRRRSRR